MTRRVALTWLVAALLLAVAAATVLVRRHTAALAAQAVDTGSAIFHGSLPIAGHLAAHAEALPTMSTQCSNCHEAKGSSTVASVPGTAGLEGQSSTGVYALRLDQAWLTQPRSRRGGPPSAYDAASLCATLRSGVDPAQVVLPTTMPRYDASDEQCRALWAYLTSR